MPDAIFTIADAFSPEVLTAQANKVYTEKSALNRTGVAVDVTDRVQFNLGGQTITRPIFLGGLEAKDLDITAVTANDTQKTVYSSEIIPIANKIIPVQFTGSSLEDALQNPGVYNDLIGNMSRGVVKAMDATMISHAPALIAGVANTTDFGAEGVAADYILDLTSAADKMPSWDALVEAKSKFLDADDGEIVIIMHSDGVKRLKKDKDVKGALQGRVIAEGLTITLDGMRIVTSNNVYKSGAEYHAYLAKAGAIGYAMKRGITARAVYKGNDVDQVDFTARFAIMRNYMDGLESIVIIKHNVS